MYCNFYVPLSNVRSFLSVLRLQGFVLDQPTVHVALNMHDIFFNVPLGNNQFQTKTDIFQLPLQLVILS